MFITVVLAVGAVLGSFLIAWAYHSSGATRVWQETAEGYRARSELLAQDNEALRLRIILLEQKVEALLQRPNLDTMQAENRVIAADLAILVKKTAAELAERVEVVAASLAAMHEPRP